MAQVKTVTTTSGENTITFDSFYPYVWIRNSGDNDITAANYSGASAGDENTVSVKAGEVAMIQTETENIYIIGATTAEIHAQGFAECPFKRVAKGGEQISVESLSVTTNGTYTAPSGTAYSPVTVDVQEQPWQPLQDGYSNFWFELTNDTLSPWLNFSAKDADAVIDWGDGSGEQPLDTLSPTHTYSKAGRYVVKCKGVTEIAAQHTVPYNTEYLNTLHYVELNNEVVSFDASAFARCVMLKKVLMPNVSTFGSTVFTLCVNLLELPYAENMTTLPASYVSFSMMLKDVIIPNTIANISASAFYYAQGLNSIVIPASVTTIGNSAFAQTYSLKEIHIQATVPPTLGNSVFQQIYAGYVIYVPTGTGDTYKAAAGWSAYSDHILEEGETVTRSMKAKFAKEEKALEDTGDMR